MTEKERLKELYDVFMNDESACTSCELRMLILDALEDLMVDE